MRRIDNLAARSALALLPLAVISAASLLVTDSVDGDSATAAPAAPTTAAPTTTVKATTTTIAAMIDPMDAGPLKSIFGLDVAFDADDGDCFIITGLSLNKPELDVVDCDEPHRYQVFEVADLPFASDYVVADIKAASEELCNPAFGRFVGLIDARSRFTWGYNYPSEADWPTVRSVRCFLFLENEGLYTGDGEGSNY